MTPPRVISQDDPERSETALKRCGRVPGLYPSSTGRGPMRAARAGPEQRGLRESAAEAGTARTHPVHTALTDGAQEHEIENAASWRRSRPTRPHQPLGLGGFHPRPRMARPTRDARRAEAAHRPGLGPVTTPQPEFTDGRPDPMEPLSRAGDRRLACDHGLSACFPSAARPAPSSPWREATRARHAPRPRLLVHDGAGRCCPTGRAGPRPGALPPAAGLLTCITCTQRPYVRQHSPLAR